MNELADPTLPPETAELAPLRSEERIQALDVVRGFALLGIFLMNVEWFNRAGADMGSGLPAGLTGANWWASRLIYVLVQGKFWTMFSLLFGMGFAVMLTRAEHAGRSFLRPYLRRITALAVFGAAHFIFLWGGDILFSYAVAAFALLILLYGNWKWILLGLVALVGLGFLPHMKPLWGMAASLAFVGALALYLRGEKRISFGAARSLPLFAFVMLVLGTLVALAATVFWLLPHGPKEPRLPLTIFGVALLTLGTLAARFHSQVETRQRGLGVTVYLFPFLMMTTFGFVQRFTPPPAPVPAASVAAPTTPAPDSKPGEKKPRKTEAERQAEQQAERAKWVEKNRLEVQTETQALSKGSYREVLKLRASKFLKKAPEEAGFATVLIGMFLLGAWFIRSGVMTNPREHLPLFRKLAWMALPLGVGLGLIGAAMSTAGDPSNPRDIFQAASGLLMIGNLPACLGYVSVLILMVHSDTVFSKVRVLAPLGRMALTTYLMQSLISATFFFGYGFGHWGMGRGWQVLYVLVVFTLQVLFSHWWLDRFRYGPMEWLWRAITYLKLPAMRLDATEPGGPMRPVEVPAP